ncbi:unnamed protein product [Malus baccata var. baccata]|uniref:Uncharacterized protein n=1 Tax=Malus domestica TaxID=3750 RepID=A0A498JGH5_MALDO|nr:hypothetical protein DVH24_024324 [Malus domestica]
MSNVVAELSLIRDVLTGTRMPRENLQFLHGDIPNSLGQLKSLLFPSIYNLSSIEYFSVTELFLLARITLYFQT